MTSSCVIQEAKQEPCKQLSTFEIGGAQAVIFPAGLGYVTGNPFQDSLKYWTPTPQDIVNIEPVVQPCAEATVPDRKHELILYARQYTGFILGGTRLLFVQFIRHPDTMRWRCEPANVPDDGGDDWFYFEVDLEDRVCRPWGYAAPMNATQS